MSIVRTRPHIGIPKSKRGIVRMEQAVFKTIVQMAYEMELAEYVKNILDIHTIIHNNFYFTDRPYLCNRYHNKRYIRRSDEYIPTKKIWETIYKVFTIKGEDEVDKKYKYSQLKSNRIKYEIRIRESLSTGKPEIVDIVYGNDMLDYIMNSNDMYDISDYLDDYKW